MTTVFHHYPLEFYYSLEDKPNECYDVDRDKVVRVPDVVPMGRIHSSKLRLIGDNATIKYIYRSLNDGISPLPLGVTRDLVEARMLEKWPPVTWIPLAIRARSLLIGKAKYNGIFAGGVSYHAIASDVLTSAIHKYIRRGFYWKAAWCVFDRDSINDSAPPAFATRLYNRLGPIIALEDVGIGHHTLPLTVDEAMKELKLATLPEQRLPILFGLMHNATLAHKSRELSHLRASFHLLLERDSTMDAARFPFLSGWVDIDTTNLLECFKRMFALNSDLCFIPLFRALLGYRGKKGDTKLARRMLEHVMENERKLADSRYIQLFDVLSRWYLKDYKALKEAWMFPIQIVLVALRRPPTPVPIPQSRLWYLHLIRNAGSINPIKIDDYCVDVHTRDGKKVGKSIANFATEGADVRNESPLTTQVYKHAYMWCKSEGLQPIRIEKVDIPIQQPHHPSFPDPDDATIPRGQILTSKYKVYTYFPGDGSLVFKGPWGSKYSEKIANMRTRSNIVRKLLGDDGCVLCYDVKADERGNAWLTCPNLSNVPKCEWTMVRKKGDADKNEVLVVDRTSMGVIQLSSLPSREQEEVLFGDEFLYGAYVLMAMLGAGDMGPWNCLSSVVDGKPVGFRIVDYEDNSGRKNIERPEDVFARNTAFTKALIAKGAKGKADLIREFVASLKGTLPELIGLVDPASTIDLNKNLSMLETMAASL